MNPKKLAVSLPRSVFRPVSAGKSVTRMVAGSMAVVIAVLGLSLVTAGPAAAAPVPGVWVAYGNTNPITSSNSTWRCGPTRTVESRVGAQICAIRSSNGRFVQAAVIVRNDRSSLYPVEVAVDLRYGGDWLAGTWACSRSGVGPDSWSVCFGDSYEEEWQVYASAGGANGVPLDRSPAV